MKNESQPSPCITIDEAELATVHGGFWPIVVGVVGIGVASFWQVWNAGHNKGLQDRPNQCRA